MANAGIFRRHRPVRALNVSPVQPQTAELRAGHLDKTHLRVQQDLQGLLKCRRADGGSVGDGVLIQKTMGQENDTLASSVAKHVVDLLFALARQTGEIGKAAGQRTV